MTWNDILSRDDLVGGDFETVENGDVYRGSISKVERRGEAIFFESAWIAVLPQGSDQWEVWHKTDFFVDTTTTIPKDIGQGRIHFVVPFLGTATIFPKGGSKLDPAKVEGLVLPE